jgi:hypothetical protein
MADELKPCPFCGDDGIVRQCGGRDRKLVQCDICGISHFSWQDRPIEYSLLARAEAAEQLAEAAASQLRAAVDAYERAEGKLAWRPIETAPKDGTHILLSAPGRVTCGEWIVPNGPDWDDEPLWGSWDGNFSEENPPTHWQPLPAPPAILAPDTSGEGGES